METTYTKLNEEYVEKTEKDKINKEALKNRKQVIEKEIAEINKALEVFETNSEEI